MGTATGEVILLVDDNPGLRRMTRRMLMGLGYRVYDASDGNQALALLDAGEGIDLLFTDVGLPGGLDGYELAERARRCRPGLKVLFATGYGGEAQAARRGGDPLILKPYRGDDLAARIRAGLAPSLGP
jgi:CheY-like chemotaxis protein